MRKNFQQHTRADLKQNRFLDRVLFQTTAARVGREGEVAAEAAEAAEAAMMEAAKAAVRAVVVEAIAEVQSPKSKSILPDMNSAHLRYMLRHKYSQISCLLWYILRLTL